MEGICLMNETEVHVQNPFALRESLQIVLEVVWTDLPPRWVPRLRSFVHLLPDSTLPQPIAVGEEEREGLSRCLVLFHQSRTSHWLRNDLSRAVADLEVALAKN